MASELVQVPEDLVKLHRYIYYKVDLLFVNSNTFFLALSSKKCFTAVKNIAKRKSDTIFKVFKDIYIYYMKSGFRIITLHKDG